MAYYSDLYEKLVPYIAGEQPKDRRYIKLNTNENPYPPSPMVQKAIQSAIEKLPLYPDMDSNELRRTIAQLHGISPGQVFLGNGSDEVLAFAFAAFFAGKRLLAPDVTYSFYPSYSTMYGADYHTVPLNQDFSVPHETFLQNAPVVIANPNAPTGRMMPIDELDTIAAHLDSIGEVLLVDEAYAAFAKETALPLLHKYNNILIVRTLSKSHSLAGLRVGYALGSNMLIEALSRVKNSFNSYPLDWLAQAGANAALLDTAYTQAIISKINQTRDKMYNDLVSANINVIPSDTNFLFVQADKQNALNVQKALREQGILVRHFTAARTAPYLRISIGLPEQMETVTKALISIIK